MRSGIVVCFDATWETRHPIRSFLSHVFLTYRACFFRVCQIMQDSLELGREEVEEAAQPFWKRIDPFALAILVRYEGSNLLSLEYVLTLAKKGCCLRRRCFWIYCIIILS